MSAALIERDDDDDDALEAEVAWEGLLEGINAVASDARRTAIKAEKDTFLNMID